MSDATNSHWAALAPDLREREAFRQDLARQVRIFVRAGKSDGEVTDWLQTLGLSAEAAAYVRTQATQLKVVVPPSPDARDRRRERHERWRKSRHLAETEPDHTFALPGDSYAQVLARDVGGGRRGWIVTAVVVALVSAPLGLALLSFLFK